MFFTIISLCLEKIEHVVALLFPNIIDHHSHYCFGYVTHWSKQTLSYLSCHQF